MNEEIRYGGAHPPERKRKWTYQRHDIVLPDGWALAMDWTARGFTPSISYSGHNMMTLKLRRANEDIQRVFGVAATGPQVRNPFTTVPQDTFYTATEIVRRERQAQRMEALRNTLGIGPIAALDDALREANRNDDVPF